MSSVARFGVHALSTAFGLLMVGLAAVGAHGPALGLGIATLVAVGVAMTYRPAATLAVLGAVVTIVANDPPYAFVALSGLCAVAYLVCRHAAAMSSAVVMASWPTVVGALGFTVVGVVAVSFPLYLPWAPLAAPLAALAIYLLAARPFLG
jgi:hypothetical protein